MTQASPAITPPPLREDYLRALRTQAWKTMGARYNAARRLRRRDRLANASIATFSAIAIALVIIQKTYAFAAGSAADNFLTALSACLAVFILVISLMEWGSSNGVKAEWLHRNAEELNAFQGKLQLLLCVPTSAPDWNEVDRMREEYERLKASCPYNHDPVDLQRFAAQHWNSREFFPDGKSIAWAFVEKTVREVRFYFFGIKTFMLCWIVVGSLLAFTPWSQRMTISPSGDSAAQSQPQPIHEGVGAMAD